MAASTIMWLDEANKTAEFEPVGTHPDYQRLGLGRAMLLHGMHLVREAGASHITVACLGAPGHPKARGLYYSVGFRKSPSKGLSSPMLTGVPSEAAPPTADRQGSRSRTAGDATAGSS